MKINASKYLQECSLILEFFGVSSHYSNTGFRVFKRGVQNKEESTYQKAIIEFWELV